MPFHWFEVSGADAGQWMRLHPRLLRWSRISWINSIWKASMFLNQCMPCKHMVSFLPLKFCAFCRKHPLPFALSLSFCLSNSTLASALDFTATWCPIRVQISNAVCWPIARAESSPVCECVTLAIPDNVTLSDSIKMRYMSELLPVENEKKKMLEYGISIIGLH